MFALSLEVWGECLRLEHLESPSVVSVLKLFLGPIDRMPCSSWLSHDYKKLVPQDNTHQYEDQNNGIKSRFHYLGNYADINVGD